jgi:ethanolamine utilization microcompartment shell protein EutL
MVVWIITRSDTTDEWDPSPSVTTVEVLTGDNAEDVKRRAVQRVAELEAGADDMTGSSAYSMDYHAERVWIVDGAAQH